jgi:hypothetical protein
LKGLILFLVLSQASYATYKIEPDPTCIVKGRIDYLFGGKKSIDRPINCAINEKPELSFCEGDEVKSPKGKNKMKVITLDPIENMAYIYAPNYGYNNQNIQLDMVSETEKFDCAARLATLKKQIKWVVENEVQLQDKPKEVKN